MAFTKSAGPEKIPSHGSAHAGNRMTDGSKSIAVSGSPFVAAVSFMRVQKAGSMLVPPDGMWDLVFIRDAYGTRAVRTGLATKAVRLVHAGTEEILAISFKASAKVVTADPVVSLNNGYVLQGDHRRFAIAGDVFEIPTFDNADTFVARLNKRGLLRSDPRIEAILDGEPIATSARTLQRQFKLATGMTHKRFTMIERARLAADSLRKGEAAQNVVHTFGFYDQAHLINSLREIVGQTPSQLGLPETPRL
jgi:hypothetical protein